tara:strand:- start:506 stop:697 length:192 start_codon:yes stop_codon:yes gene_type:complete
MVFNENRTLSNNDLLGIDCEVASFVVSFATAMAAKELDRLPVPYEKPMGRGMFTSLKQIYSFI